jgi:hypothetical protein
MTSTSDNIKDYQKLESEIELIKKQLKEKVLNQDYSFPDDPFEPSSAKAIDADKLTSFGALKAYLKNTYGVGEKPELHRKTIEKIIGISRAEYLIGLNKSEYYKVLTLFTTLSIVKKGWFNLFVTSPTRTTKPSLSDNPSLNTINKIKDLHDKIIQYFYTRLIQGMSDQEKERYQDLFLQTNLLTGFDEYLFSLDTAIQDLFGLVQQEDEDYIKEDTLPDWGLDIAIDKTRVLLYFIFSKNLTEGYRADTLRASLIKFA